MKLLCIIVELFFTSKNYSIASVSRICTRSQWMLLALHSLSRTLCRCSRL